MGVPPQLAGNEAPLEKLATRHGESINSSAGADHGHHSRSVLADVHNLQLMPQASCNRHADTEDQYDTGSTAPDEDPDEPRHRMADKGDSGHNLVHEGQRKCEI